MAPPKPPPSSATRLEAPAEPRIFPEARDAIHERFEQLRARFKAAHAASLRALRGGDYRALRAAIATERTILEEQGVLIEKHLQFASALVG